MKERKMPAAAKAKKPGDLVEFLDVEQLSEDWYALRRGIPTASKFSSILAEGEGKMRTKYLCQLAGEIISGETAETFRNEAMERGRIMEDAARAYYQRAHLADVERIGFVRRTVRKHFHDYIIGASPDAKVGKRKGLEIKTMRPELLFELKRNGAAGPPPQFRAQCQGTMWAADWDELDLLLFYDGRKKPMALSFTMVRDDAFIGRLAQEVERFDYDLRKLVEQWK